MKPKAPFTAVTDKILFDSRITPIELKVYILICQAAYGKKTYSFPSQKRLSFLTGYSRQHINKSIQNLASYGYLTKHRFGRKLNNVYEITLFGRDEVSQFKKSIEERILFLMKDDVVSTRQGDVTYTRHSDVSSSLHGNTSDVVSSRFGDVSSTYQEAIQYESTQSLEPAHFTFGSFQKTKTSCDSKNESHHTETVNEFFADKEEKSSGGLHSVSLDSDTWKVLFER